MLFDAKGNLIYQNPASLRIHGFESDTEGRISSSDLPTTWEAWDEARRPIAFGEWPVSRVFRKERFSNQVLHVRRVETGHEFDGSYNGSPIFDQNGELIMGFITIRDITGQVAATQALTESEKRLSTFMEAMPQMAFIADPQGNVTYYNKRHYEYFGVEPGQTEGWAWKDKQIHHPDDLQRTVERWQHSLKTGAPYQIEYRLRRHDGAFLWHLGRAYPVRGENGRILCWTGTNTNIHDQKEMEQELRDALRIRDEFLSIASHELKTPITTIRLQTQNQERLVKKAECGDLPIDRLKKSTAMVSAQVSRLTALVNDMLDVSRISAGKLSLNREPINLSELLRETIDCEHPGLRAANIPLTLDVQEPVIIEGDRLRLSQVMSNLISNVTKYAPGKPLTIRLTTSGDFAHLEVEDQGPGISRDYIGRIFERYERAVQNPTAITGLGLGLYISRQIVKAHGGEIWAENSPDGGAKFTVKIPKTQHSTHHEQGVTT